MIIFFIGVIFVDPFNLFNAKMPNQLLEPGDDIDKQF